MNPTTDIESPLLRALAPKSDQLNAEDLIAGPRVVTIKAVRIDPDAPQQKITIHLEGGLRPYKPCKTMGRVLLAAWGLDGNWIGRSMRLYRDPSIKFGSDQPGGIRISHLSHITRPLVEQLTVKKGSRAPFRVEPLDPNDIPTADPVGFARNVAADAKRRGWTNDMIKAAMKGKTRIEDMTDDERGTFLRDLMHAPGTVSEELASDGGEE